MPPVVGAMVDEVGFMAGQRRMMGGGGGTERAYVTETNIGVSL